MILYPKRYYGLGLVFRRSGSAFPRALPFALLSAGVTIGLHFSIRESLQNEWIHPYPYQVFAFIVGFIVIFRSNFSYARYNEGRTSLATLQSYLADVTVQLLAFDLSVKHPSGTSSAATTDTNATSATANGAPSNEQRSPSATQPPPPTVAPPPIAPRRAGSGQNHPIASTGSGLGARRSRELRLEPEGPLPPQPRAQQHVAGWPAGAHAYAPHARVDSMSAPEAERSTNVGLDAGQQRFRDELLHAISLLHGVVMQALRLDGDEDNLHPHDWARPPPVDPMRVGGTNGASYFANLGTSLHKVFMLPSAAEELADYNRRLPILVIGGVSDTERRALSSCRRTASSGWLQEARALSAASVNARSPHVEVGAAATGPVPQRRTSKHSVVSDDTEPGWGAMYTQPLRTPTGMVHVLGGAQRVELAYAWVQYLLTARLAEGGLASPPPLMTRSWQGLSLARHAYEQCRKLVDTPYPFPWAQMVVVLLILLAVTLPFVVVAYIDSIYVSVGCSFLTVLAYSSLNEVARDIEDPYIFEPNELPLARLQYEFNERLLAAAYTVRPNTLWKLS